MSSNSRMRSFLNALPCLRAALFLALALSPLGCSKSAHGSASSSIPPSPASGVANYTYEVVHVWPHDANAFTQGLLFYNGSLLESTGIKGQSTLREVEWKTGKVLKMVNDASNVFGEGLAVLDGKAYQLTWRSHHCFIYNVDTFQLLGEFRYDGEGWGLTTDGKWLIMSDGSSHIVFRDPKDFSIVRTIDVQDQGVPVAELNELEYIHGEIFANIWQMNRIVRIDPASGRVVGNIDFTGLLPDSDRSPKTDVLNGIAYDPEQDRLIVTGKYWPKLFEVRLKAK